MMRKKRLGSSSVKVFIAIAALLLGTSVTPAHAAPLYQIWFYHSQKCVDLQYGSATPRAKIQQWDCANPGNPNFGHQQWDFEIGSDGWASIYYGNSNMCLKTTGFGNGDLVILDDCTGVTNKWRGYLIQDGGIDYYQLVHVGGRCMDMPRGSNSNGEQVQIWDCVDGNRQQWLSWAVDKP
jgi:hypothetical protein